jgi:integrase
MARPGFLSRRDGGRYFLQIRVGNQHAELYGRKILRASLMTGDFAEARRRLVDNLGWVQELIAAPDLEAIGSVIDRRLMSYTAAGVPQAERALAERTAFEHQIRHYIARANQRGYAFAHVYLGFASRWVDFVDQNKAAEGELARLAWQQAYERGRADVTTAVAQGWVPPPGTRSLSGPPAAPPAALGLSDAVHQTIDAIVKTELSKQLADRAASVPAAPADTAAPPLAPALGTDNLRLSEALKLYLAPPGQKRARRVRGRADTAAIVQFAVDFLGDPPLEKITLKDWNRVDEAMTDIPHTKGLPNSCRSLFKRYEYAQKHGWKNLSRVSVTTIEKRYHDGLDKFIHWAIDQDIYAGKPPKFECLDGENTAALPRDAFDDDELIALISLPLFTGCARSHRIWVKGEYFVQNHLYWGYLILILSGLRPGEVGQLRCADLVTDGENFFFDLRAFDARKGRVAVKDLINLKSNSAGRVVPIHPLLIELGLLDRVHELEKIGEGRLFPEWEMYTRRDGTVRWSQCITKSWQYIKRLLKARADLTLYSSRHLMAEWLDRAGIAQRTRNRILGHASGVPGGYGRNGMPNAEQVAAINEANPPVINRMREILLPAKQRADRGELIVLKPWLALQTD